LLSLSGFFGGKLVVSGYAKRAVAEREITIKEHETSPLDSRECITAHILKIYEVTPILCYYRQKAEHISIAIQSAEKPPISLDIPRFDYFTRMILLS
jgi:hypothetical protein